MHCICIHKGISILHGRHPNDVYKTSCMHEMYTSIVSEAAGSCMVKERLHHGQYNHRHIIVDIYNVSHNPPPPPPPLPPSRWPIPRPAAAAAAAAEAAGMPPLGFCETWTYLHILTCLHMFTCLHAIHYIGSAIMPRRLRPAVARAACQRGGWGPPPAGRRWMGAARTERVAAFSTVPPPAGPSPAGPVARLQATVAGGCQRM